MRFYQEYALLSPNLKCVSHSSSLVAYKHSSLEALLILLEIFMALIRMKLMMIRTKNQKLLSIIIHFRYVANTSSIWNYEQND